MAPGWAGPSTYPRCPDNNAVNTNVAECFGLQAVRGKTMTGTELAMLIERMVTALNSRDIPSAGSMLEFFNKEVCRRSSRPLCRASHSQNACCLLFAMPTGSRGTMHSQPRPSACGDDGPWKELDCDATCTRTPAGDPLAGVPVYAQMMFACCSSPSCTGAFLSSQKARGATPSRSSIL